jgi:hypothetical protein
MNTTTVFFHRSNSSSVCITWPTLESVNETHAKYAARPSVCEAAFVPIGHSVCSAIRGMFSAVNQSRRGIWPGG